MFELKSYVIGKKNNCSELFENHEAGNVVQYYLFVILMRCKEIKFKLKKDF